MKISFEGATLDDIFNQMENALDCSVGKHKDPEPQNPTLQANAPKDIVPEVIVPVDKPVDKPVDRMAKVRAARGKNKPKPAPEPEEEAPEPFGEADPAEAVKVRQKTLEDLQTAYADGHHKEVLELLSRFGNGAKSFRELPPDAFVPIREAIDNGALT